MLIINISTPGRVQENLKRLIIVIIIINISIEAFYALNLKIHCLI